MLGIDVGMVVDTDAQKTKAFQLDEIRKALRGSLNDKPKLFEKSPLLSQVWSSDDLFSLFSILVMREISTAIKGRGLIDDEKRYVESEVAFSRLHRILDREERRLVFDCFRRYQAVIFEEYGLLDSDDVAISLDGRLRTPVWQLRRRVQGFDLVLVDEAQLFNENEKRLFPLLSKGASAHVPIALALDEAQEIYGFTAAGLGALGIPDIESQNLPSNHRSTREIVNLAFFIIQKSTDLFGSDFPDFTEIESGMVPSTHPLAETPRIVVCNEDAKSYARFLLKVVQKLRAQNVRQIAVVSHTEAYWDDLVEEFGKSGLPLHVLMQRGEKVSPDEPLVILSRPAFVGGQEFDAVVIVGMEQGLVPPRISDNPPLAAALEQQLLRELYLTVSRSRYRVIFALNRGSAANAILAEAISQDLVSAPGS
jgi:superfamily I DNA/RNA helicase